MAFTFFSPAKVNLFLRVVRRRDDGYHDIVSLFQTISLGDRLTFSLAESDSIRCSDPAIPVDGRNLVMKAIELFRSKTGTAIAVSVDIDKKIPVEAGLGGGSSNAATTLWALNLLSGNPAANEQLMQWAGELGSDVAFFFSQGAALCTGRGEIITPMASLPSTSLWIVKPHEGLSTPKVYKALDPAAILPCDGEAAAAAFYRGAPSYVNDLEPPAFALMPKLADIKETLLSGGYDAVLMSGSGTSFFCIGDAIPPDIPGCSVFKAAFLNRSAGSWY